MRLPASVEIFAEHYMVPYADTISWCSIIILLALFGFICYHARANKPLKSMLLLALVVWAIVLAILTIITWSGEAETFLFLRM